MRLPKKRAKGLCAYCGEPAERKVIDPRDPRVRIEVCVADESRYHRILRATGVRPLDLPNRQQTISAEEIDRGLALLASGVACKKAWEQTNRLRRRRGEEPIPFATYHQRVCQRAGYVRPG